MKSWRNVGSTDQAIRIIVGLAIAGAGLFFVHGHVVSIVLDVVGAIVFLTGLLGFCVFYKLFGIRTCPRR